MDFPWCRVAARVPSLVAPHDLDGQGSARGSLRPRALAAGLHDHIWGVTVDPIVQYLNHVHAAQFCGGLGFAPESRQRLFGLRNRGVDELYRDWRTEREMFRPPNRTHASCAQLGQEPVSPGNDKTFRHTNLAMDITTRSSCTGCGGPIPARTAVRCDMTYHGLTHGLQVVAPCLLPQCTWLGPGPEPYLPLLDIAAARL